MSSKPDSGMSWLPMPGPSEAVAVDAASDYAGTGRTYCDMLLNFPATGLAAGSSWPVLRHLVEDLNAAGTAAKPETVASIARAHGDHLNVSERHRLATALEAVAEVLPVDGDSDRPLREAMARAGGALR